MANFLVLIGIFLAHATLFVPVLLLVKQLNSRLKFKLPQASVSFLLGAILIDKVFIGLGLIDSSLEKRPRDYLAYLPGFAFALYCYWRATGENYIKAPSPVKARKMAIFICWPMALFPLILPFIRPPAALAEWSGIFLVGGPFIALAFLYYFRRVLPKAAVAVGLILNCGVLVFYLWVFYSMSKFNPVIR